jgi:hypothetical protein
MYLLKQTIIIVMTASLRSGKGDIHDKDLDIESNPMEEKVSYICLIGLSFLSDSHINLSFVKAIGVRFDIKELKHWREISYLKTIYS